MCTNHLSLEGPSGPAGPSASPNILYDYLGCYAQTGSKTSTSGLALPSYQATYSTYVNSACTRVCQTGGFMYAGTVNQGTTGAECWCGNQITYVTMLVALHTYLRMPVLAVPASGVQAIRRKYVRSADACVL